MTFWQDHSDLAVFSIGLAAAVVFLASLAVSLIREDWRLWPLPPGQSLISQVVWGAFRVCNIAVLILAVSAIASQHMANELQPLQIVFLLLALAVFGLYLYALWSLGKDATYGAANGLATGGIYAFSRNPQYATAIAAYTCLGLATATTYASTLSFVLAATYAAMAIVEEPWLAARYGATYREYCRHVPRYINGRLLISKARNLSPNLSTSRRS